jgi:protein required for attachment to host cells
METTWFVVADRSQARIYEQLGAAGNFRCVEVLQNPEGRLQPSEIEDDRPGRAQDSHSPHRHSYSREVSPTEQFAFQFASLIAHRLHAAHLEQHFSRLVLVAGPKFLGKLRGALFPSTARLVVGSLDKDLVELPEDELFEHLGRF